MDFFLLCIKAIGLLYAIYLRGRFTKDFPPHPLLSVPFLGDVLSLGGTRREGFRKLREKFGGICGFLLGPQRVVLVSDFDLIQEVCSREELNGRVSKPLLAKHRRSLDPFNPEMNPGLITSRGQMWQEQRRFALHSLKSLGFGNYGTEALILDEVKSLCNFLDDAKEHPIDIKNQAYINFLNALWLICTGDKISDNRATQDWIARLAAYMRTKDTPIMTLVAINKHLSWLAEKLFPRTSQDAFEAVINFIDEKVQSLSSTYQNDSLSHYVDHFFKMSIEQEKHKRQMSFVGKQGKINLINNLFDLFVAGSETSSLTLNWAILYMVLNPDIQQCVHQELDGAIGKGIQPSFEERRKTPYIEAVLHEVQRIASVSDRTPPHFALTDCWLSTGHFIPKDTLIQIWLGGVLLDSRHFKDPGKFDPMRFIGKHGEFLAHPKVIPFGLGKRRCLGETLAKMEQYLFFTGIMTRFKVEKANPEDDLSTEPLDGVLLSPQEYSFKFIVR